MSENLYITLGVEETASPEAIRKAYRALALKHHPDRSDSPHSAEIFIAVTQAYEALSDPVRRKEYDRLRALRQQMAESAAKQTEKKQSAPPRPQPQPQPAPRPRLATASEVQRLVQLMGKQRFSEAESLAESLLTVDPKLPVPYAALGDIARARGDLRRASKMYAYAAQFDPRNEIYLRKHESLMDALTRREESEYFQRNAEGRWVAPIVGIALCIVAACFIALSPEQPVFAKNMVVSTWTFGLMSMLFFSGAVMGATMSLAEMVDRFEVTTSLGKLSPTVVFMAFASLNLWIATGLYMLVGLIQRGFSLTITRMVMALIAVVLILTIGSMANRLIDPYQTLMWGGSIASIGAIIGWSFADGFKF